MPLYLREPGEGRGGNGDVEMAAFPRAGVAGVFGAVVADLEQRRVQRRSSAARSRSRARRSRGFSLRTAPRSRPEDRPSVNTNTSGTTTRS